jgi:Lon protease-like protein
VAIPLFPLHVVLFPGAALPLRVFEERYRAMVSDLLGDGDDLPAEPARFGVAAIREGSEVGGRAETHLVGCIAVVERARRNPDGTTDLLARGSERFKILGRPEDAPYPRAEIAPLEERAGNGAEEALRLAAAALARYLEVIARLQGSGPPGAGLPAEPVAASYVMSSLLALEPSRLQQLLEAPTAALRLALAAKLARSEAGLLEWIGPPARRPRLDAASPN